MKLYSLEGLTLCGVAIWLFGIIVIVTLAVQDEIEATNDNHDKDPWTKWQLIRAGLCIIFWPVTLGYVVVWSWIENAKYKIYRKA